MGLRFIGRTVKCGSGVERDEAEEGVATAGVNPETSFMIE